MEAVWWRTNILKGFLRGENEKKVEKHWSWHLLQCENETCQTQFVPHLAPKSPPYSSQVLVTITTDSVIVSESAPKWDPQSRLENSLPSLSTSTGLPRCAPHPSRLSPLRQNRKVEHSVLETRPCPCPRLGSAGHRGARLGLCPPNSPVWARWP